MSIVDIIRKSVRTDLEIKHAFNVLMKSDGTLSQYFELHDIPDFEKILDNLRMCSKTRLFSTLYCPYQFKCHYIYQLRPEVKSAIMVDGKNMHWINDIFWKDKVKVNDFMGRSTWDTTLKQKYLSLIPTGELTPFILKVADDFLTFEYNRINGIFNELGKTKDVVERYVFPVATELPVENWDRWLMGIIDRIDRTTNDALAVLEYKYGKPKYLEKSYQKTAITNEFAFYDILMQGKNVFVVNDNNTLTPIQEQLGLKPRFYYGSMIFLQDVEETATLVKINKRMLTEMNKKIKGFWNRLNTGNFKPNANDACLQWCEYYWGHCENNPEWQEIEHCMDDDVEPKELNDDWDDFTDDSFMDSELQPF